MSAALSSGQISPATLPDLHLSKAGTVNVMVMQDDGQIVIGGSFASVNDVPLKNLARIDIHGAVDAAWAPNPDGPVLALATAGTNVFVGGTFQNIGGQVRGGVALIHTAGLGEADPTWNPNAYPAQVYAFGLSGTNLFVGGTFLTIGGLTRHNAAKLGITGNGLADAAWDPSPNAQVNTVLISGTNCYLGGQFTMVGLTGRNRVAKCATDGTGAVDGLWNPNVDSGVPGPTTNSYVSSMVLSDTNLFISGVFFTVSGSTQLLIAKVNAQGTGAVDVPWTVGLFPTLTGGALTPYALAVSGTNLFVAGAFIYTFIQGSGTNFAKIATDDSGGWDFNWVPSANTPPKALLAENSWLIVGGNFSLVNGALALGIGKIDQGTAVSDGDFFTQVSMPGDVYAMVRQANGKVVVGGDFWLSGLDVRPNLARINADGSLDGTWDPAADGAVRALALSGTNLFAGGLFAHVGGQQHNGLARMDTSGTDLVDPTWNPPTGLGAAVYALAVNATNVYVGGTNLGINGLSSISFAKVNATGSGTADTNWNSAANGTVRAIAIDPTNVFVGGDFSNIHGVFISAVVRFPASGNGTVDGSWNAGISSSNVATAYALAIADTNLFVGGSFEMVGGQSRVGLAKVSTSSGGAVDSVWNPAVSNQLGSVLPAYALAIQGTNLYVGGLFGTNPAVNLLNLARVSTGGSGTVDPSYHPNPDADVRAILPSGQDTYVGGTFQNIGGSYALAPDAAPRNGFALWAVADAPVLIKASPTNILMTPNPADGPEITYFEITQFTAAGGLFLNDGVTPVHVGDFITVTQGAAGLTWSGAGGVISAVSSLNNTLTGAGTAATTLNLGTNQGPVFFFSSPHYVVNENGGSVVVSVRKQGSGAASVSYATSDGTAVGYNAGQTLVVPNSLANVEGNSGNSYPFNIGASTMRYQQVCAASQFGAIPPGGAFITAVAFRVDGGWAGFSNTLPAIRLDLSTTSKTPDGLSSILTNNPGPDDTVVFNGPLTLSSAAAGNPATFDVVIPLTTPFFYNPASGNLLLDVRNTGGGSISQLDAVSTTGDSVSRAYAFPATATTGGSDSLGLVTQFTFSAPFVAGGADYTNTTGTLNFGVSDTNMDIAIGIINDTVFDGDKTFSISLSNPTAGATIAYPGTATITILEDDPIGSVASYTTTSLPSGLPPASGSLRVRLQPPAANGQWRLAGQAAWHTSGATVGNLVTANYRVEFLPVNGYLQPDAMITPVVSGVLLQLTNTYVLSTNAGSALGYISLLVSPDDVASNANVSLRGQWRLQGTIPWLNSGDAVTNLTPGIYGVEFKDVPNLATPASDPDVTVLPYEGTRFTGVYQTASETGAAAPNLISFGTATTNRSYLYLGQLRTDLGFGSGVVVKDRVVLTAAHLLFDGDNLAYVGGVRWFFQRYAGSYEPASQIPRGWHVFAGYSAQREADPDSSVQSAQSENLDLAALYFLESAGRGGFGGYLVSDSHTNWLTLGRNKMLAGYPMEIVSPTNQGRLMATFPTNLIFAQVYSNVYSTFGIRGYPGLGGGPLEVQFDDGNYYPAGIYMGPSESTNMLLVRELDADAANLIDMADLSGTARLSVPLPNVKGLLAPAFSGPTSDTNQFSQTSGGSSAENAYLQVNTGPQAAMDAGGGWNVLPNGIFHNGLNNRATIIGQSTVTIAFQCTRNGSYAVPYKRPDQMIGVLADGKTYMVDLPYLPPPFPYNLGIASSPQNVTLWLSNGVPTYTYEIDYAPDLISGNWSSLGQMMLTGPGSVSFTDTPASGTRFYRAKWVTCPP